MNEFQAVILAGGVGSRLFPLTESRPKSMLPIATRPLLTFQLELLEKSGFSEAIVITRADCREELAKFAVGEARAYKGKIKVILEVMEGEGGTADALRHVSHLLETDFFVLSGDIITNVYLHDLADIHRANRAHLTVLLQKPKVLSARELEEKKKEDKKKRKQREEAEEDLRQQFIGLAPDRAADRLVVFQSATDVMEQETFSVSKALLKRHPNLTVRTDYKDAHLYILSHSVLALLDERKALSSLQADVVPFLTHMQYCKIREDKWPANLARAGENKDKDGLALLPEEEELNDLLSGLHMSHAPASVADNDPVRCYAYVIDPATTYCKRCNTVHAFLEMNRDIANEKQYQHQPWSSVQDYNQIRAGRQGNEGLKIGHGSVVGKDLRAGVKCFIKKSIIGSHVKMGEGCTLSNCVVMDHVKIEDGARVENSIICDNVVVQRNSKAESCRLGPGYVVEEGTKHKNETLFIE